MTTQPPDYAYLSKGHMRQALIQTLRGMYDEPRLRKWSDKDGPFQRHPLVEKALGIKVEEFGPHTAPEIFAGDGRLEEGMGKFIFQATDGEEMCEKQVRRVLLAMTGNDPLSISTSIIAILMNTRHEAPFFYATEAAMGYVAGRDAHECFLDGSMACAKELLRACAHVDFDYPDVVLGSEYAKRKDIADTARIVARISKDDCATNSYFYGLLKIIGISFAGDAERAAAVEEYRNACERLMRHCAHVITQFAYHVGIISREKCDGKGVNTLSAIFGSEESLFIFRRFCRNPDKIAQIANSLSLIVRGDREALGGAN